MEEEEDPELTEELNEETEEARERKEKVESLGFSLTSCFLCMVSR